MLSGLITTASFLAFVGIVVWAFSRHRRNEFAAAARLPLDDEDGERS